MRKYRRGIWLCTMAAAVALAPNVGAQSLFTGTVRDVRTGARILDAEITIAALQHSAKTDARGNFVLSGIVGGRHSIVIRKLGYESVSIVQDFSGADTLTRDFALLLLAQRLPEARVLAKPAPLVSAKLRDFMRRRERGIGHFLTTDDLAKHRGRLIGDILQTIPGTKIVRPYNGLAAYVATSRGAQSLFNAAQIAGECAAAVFLDGVPAYRGNPGEPPFDVNTIHFHEIAGIEFYAGPASMPTEFRSARRTCGVVVIWTNRD